MNNQIAISVADLVKKYGIVKAVDNISFEVLKSELFGIIGPDGAGKTSLFRIIATLLKQDSGKAIIEGFDNVKDYREIRNIIGYMPGRFSLYQDLTVEENLKFFATIFNSDIKENYYLIKDIYDQLKPFADRPAGKLSGGMKQKLALSCAMIHKPVVLILDEPTTGVDAVSRKEFWEMLRKLKSAGITIIVSTPYMDEASLCDRVSLMQDGKIMSIDSPENILNSFIKDIYAIRSADMFRLNNDLQNYPSALSVNTFGQYIHYCDKKDMIEEFELVKYLSQLNHKDVEIKKINATIEDCFIDLMIKNAAR